MSKCKVKCVVILIGLLSVSTFTKEKEDDLDSICRDYIKLSHGVYLQYYSDTFKDLDKICSSKFYEKKYKDSIYRCI